MNRLFGLILLLGVLDVQAASAATLYMDPTISSLERGEAEVISIRLDTDEFQSECINAAEGVINFSGPIQVIDTSLGASIFSIWVEPPTISAEGKQVTFAGGIPNGYCGRIEGDPRLTNNVFDLVIRADSTVPANSESISAIIAFTEQTHAYLNDGSGTKADLQLQTKEVTVLPQLSAGESNPWRDVVEADTINPQEFSIQLVQQDLIHSGRYYITFNTTDKQSGIDRYEVIEEPLSQFGSFAWGRADAPWVVADNNQHILKDQSLNSIIRVRAIDKAGNEYIASYIPDEGLRTIPLSILILWSLLVISLLVLMFGSWSFISRRRKLAEQRALDQAFGMVETDESKSHSHSKNNNLSKIAEVKERKIDESVIDDTNYDQRN